LDNIFINCIDDNYFSRVIYDDISDDLPVLLNITTDIPRSKIFHNKKIKKYVMSKLNYNKLEEYIKNEKWLSLSNEHNMLNL